MDPIREGAAPIRIRLGSLQSPETSLTQLSRWVAVGDRQRTSGNTTSVRAGPAPFTFPVHRSAWTRLATGVKMTQRTRWLENLRAPLAYRSGRSIYTEPDMTMEANPDTVVARQALDLRTMASIAPLPSPEAVFVDWLLWLPRGANLRAAARQQIALIDRHASVHPDVQFLRTLLAAVAGEGAWRKPFTNL